MADTSIKNLIMGIVIFGMVMAGVILTLSSISDEMLGNRTTEFNNSFYLLDDLDDSINDLEDDTASELGEERGDAGFFDVVFKGTWVALKTIFTSFTFFTTAISEVAAWFAVPTWFLTGLISLVTLIIIFGVIKAVTKTDI